MNFLSPAFLIGLPLVAVPVLIHLLSRRQQTRISWGAMRFLTSAVTRRRRLWRLTDLLLLLLRTAAFLFFIFAFARPLLPAAWLGHSAPREVILVLDESMSMSRLQGDVTLFELQRQKAHELLDQLRPRDSVRVLLAGEPPEWLTPDPIEATPVALRKLGDQLDHLKSTLAAADLPAALREATDEEAPKEKQSRLIVVITDRQRFSWRLDEAPLWAGIQARLQKASIPTTVSVQLISEPTGPVANLSINKVETPRSVSAVNQLLNFTAQVQNRGASPSAPALLRWQVGDESLGLTTIPELAPGATTSVSVSHQFAAAGTFDVTCQLENKDALLPDNEGHLLVEVVAHLPVLLVEEPNTAEPLETDSAFVLAGLGARKADRAGAGWRSVFEPTLIAPNTLEGTDLSRFHCVVLLNVRELSPAAIEKLEAYARAGGGIWITLGANTDLKSFNERFYRDGAGLAPLKVTEPVGDAENREKFVAIRTTSETHPATALLSDIRRLDLDKARVFRRYPFDISSGRDVSVLLEVQHDDPVVVERKLEQGRVLVQSIPLGVSWSTLPLCQAYVAMLHEWLWYLSEPSLPKRNLAIGEPITEPADASAGVAVLRLPNDRSIELQPVAITSGKAFRFEGARLPGEYTLRVPGKAGEATARFFVQRNPEESNLAGLTEEDLQRLRSQPGFQIGGRFDAAVAKGAGEAPKHPVEGWLLATLAALLLGEMILAGWMTQRRHLRVQPVTMGA